MTSTSSDDYAVAAGYADRGLFVLAVDRRCSINSLSDI